MVLLQMLMNLRIGTCSRSTTSTNCSIAFTKPFASEEAQDLLVSLSIYIFLEIIHECLFYFNSHATLSWQEEESLFVLTLISPASSRWVSWSTLSHCYIVKLSHCQGGCPGMEHIVIVVSMILVNLEYKFPRLSIGNNLNSSVLQVDLLAISERSQ